MAAKMYYDQDADMQYLEGKTIGVIGFGSQGHAHALNLKDSGQKVIVGLYPGSKSWQKAEDLGLQVGTVDDVAEAADIVMVLTPDHIQKELYDNHIAHGMREGKTLMFAHGFNNPLRADHGAGGGGRVDDRAEGAGTPGATGVRGGRGGAGAAGDPPGRVGDGEADGAGLRAGDRGDEGGGAGDDVPGGDGDGPVRGADGAVRGGVGADAGGVRRRWWRRATSRSRRTSRRCTS